LKTNYKLTSTKTPKEQSENPKTDPALKATINPYYKDFLHLSATLAFAYTATTIPIHPAIIDVKAPAIKAPVVQNSPNYLSTVQNRISENITMKIKQYEYSFNKNEFAPLIITSYILNTDSRSSAL
jgi:hypothetical protein